MKQCENCGLDHEGTFGSGRFCSLKCSRGFSTKAKRKEINASVSLKLSVGYVNYACENCKAIFVGYASSKRRFCSRNCVASFTNRNRTFSDEHKRKLRVSNAKWLEENVASYPRFNPKACELIDEYGKKHGFNFQHALNGGEFHIKELGYWVDGYDKEKNVVIEVDEKHHSKAGKKEKDEKRQREIEFFLGCQFVRLKIEN